MQRRLEEEKKQKEAWQQRFKRKRGEKPTPLKGPKLLAVSEVITKKARHEQDGGRKKVGASVGAAPPTRLALRHCNHLLAHRRPLLPIRPLSVLRVAVPPDARARQPKHQETRLEKARRRNWGQWPPWHKPAAQNTAPPPLG